MRSKTKKRTFRRRVRRPYKLAALARNVAMRMAEHKYSLAVSGGPQNVTDTGSITCVTQIAQGSADTSRVGDALTLKSIEYGYFTNAIANTQALVRFMIIQWFPQVTDTNGSPPAIANNILFDGTVNAENVIQPYYHDNRNQFRVLYDRLHTVSAADEISSRYYHGFITTGFKKNVQYYGGSSTNGNNQIFLIKMSDLASSYPQVTNFIKINYVDS